MRSPLIAVVGVCASGKSTLVEGLRARGYDVCQVAQEHSYVPDMWQRGARPNTLIHLDAGLECIRRRRGDDQWPGWIRALQVERLRHARAHCDLYILTDLLSREKVLHLTLAYLQGLKDA
jgi:hypothetical protein